MIKEKKVKILLQDAIGLDFKYLSNHEIIDVLNKTNLSNEYDRMKVFYNLTKDGYVSQNGFCEILEKYFGLKLKT